MYYLSIDQTELNFQRLAQNKTVNIVTNGTVIVSNDLDFVETTVNTSNFRADSETDGRRNTDVVNVFEEIPNAAHSARSYRANNYNSITDWYLPAQQQLVQMAQSTNMVLPDDIYWSSTEDMTSNGASAITVNQTGATQVTFKSESHAVRPIRQLSYGEINPPFNLGDDLGYGIVFNIDTANKIMYIAAKVNLPDVIWGTSNNVANANFASNLLAQVNTNERYIENRGVITLSLREDSNIRLSLLITQESSEEDSTSTLLVDVINNVMLDMDNERSFAYGIHRSQVLLHAKRLMQEIGYSGVSEVRVYEGEITAANKLIPPIDFVDYIRLSIVNFEGRLLPLFYNNRLSTAFQYIEDNRGNIIIDSEGYPVKTQGSRRDPTADPNINTARFYDGYIGSRFGNAFGFRSLPGYTGGQYSYTGQYRYDSDAKEFLLDDLPEDYSTVVLEYISDPVLAERNPERLRIHKYFQEALELGIYYRIIKKLRDVPANEKFRARQDYYNELRIARMRHRIKPAELKQKLNADVGFDKTLI